MRKSATIASNVVTYTVVVAFSNTGSQLLPGMTANARIVTDRREQVLKVPNAALRVRIAGVTEPSAPGAGSSAPAASAPGRSGGGPMAALSQSLGAQVGFSEEQMARFDEVQAGLRPKFIALRELPEDQRGRAGDALRAELRARVTEIATPEQRPRLEQALAELGGRGGSTRGRVYVPGPDGKPRALALRLGISDGSMTEVLGVTGGELRAGDEVLVQAPVSGAAPTRPGGPRPPF